LQTPEGGLYVNSATGSPKNLKSEKSGVFLNFFHNEWREKFETRLTDEEKDSIDSVVTNRHQIAQCQNVGVSYVRVNEWAGAARLQAHGGRRHGGNHFYL